MARQSKPSTVMSLRLPADMMQAIRAIAEDEDRPVTSQIIRFLRVGLAAHERDQAERPMRRVG